MRERTGIIYFETVAQPFDNVVTCGVERKYNEAEEMKFKICHLRSVGREK